MFVGDLVLDLRGEWHKVVSVKPLEGMQTVYNFEVDDNHDYFVGTTGFLVHNSYCLFGQQMHSAFDRFLMALTNTTEDQWDFRLKPGQTGVDATWLGPGPSPLGPGIKYVELKPSSLSSMNKLSGQLQNWGTQGNTAVFTYNNSGGFSPRWSLW
jgi:hypothetical protein